jgi:hypothetical protein
MEHLSSKTIRKFESRQISMISRPDRQAAGQGSFVGSQKRHRNSTVPENNRKRLEKSSCKPIEYEDNREKVTRWSWV